MIKTKKMAIILLMAIMASLFLGILSSEVAYADDIWKDFDVSVKDDNLTVKTGESEGNAWQTLITKYQGFITGVAGVGAVTMVVLFIIQFLKLGASAGNPNARSQAMVGVLWTGLAAAGLGAVALITGIFYNAI